LNHSLLHSSISHPGYRCRRSKELSDIELTLRIVLGSSSYILPSSYSNTSYMAVAGFRISREGTRSRLFLFRMPYISSALADARSFGDLPPHSIKCPVRVASPISLYLGSSKHTKIRFTLYVFLGNSPTQRASPVLWHRELIDREIKRVTALTFKFHRNPFPNKVSSCKSKMNPLPSAKSKSSSRSISGVQYKAVPTHNQEVREKNTCDNDSFCPSVLPSPDPAGVSLIF